MSERTVQIAPQAALNEATALAEYYRNRNLLLAGAVHELRASDQAKAEDIERLKTEVEALTVANEDIAHAGGE